MMFLNSVLIKKIISLKTVLKKIDIYDSFVIDNLLILDLNVVKLKKGTNIKKCSYHLSSYN